MKASLWAVALVCVFVLIAMPAKADESAEKWYDRVDFQGDLRLRHESIDEEGEEDRRRLRFRTRFGFGIDVAENVNFVLRLASGGGNPVSTNQSFDGGFSTKDIGIDLAYVDWAAADGLNLYAGKMKNPIFKAGKVPLIYDSDLTPEGFAGSYSSGMLFSTLAGYTIEERSSTDDSFLYHGQVGVKVAVGDASKLTGGVGYFGYTNTVGNEPFYNGNAQGNSVDGNGNYIYDYENAEVFVQFDTRIADLPVQLYAHFTQNQEVSVEDTAYAFGAKIGSAKQQGTQQFSWTFQDIEADSVIATFNDSDFGGGGTDSDGHMLKYTYMLRDKISLGGTLMINNVDRFQGTEHDYTRLQLDVEFLFD
ncbi:MAG: putative porin [Woeseiaceae bacterium]